MAWSKSSFYNLIDYHVFLLVDIYTNRNNLHALHGSEGQTSCKS